MTTPPATPPSDEMPGADQSGGSAPRVSGWRRFRNWLDRGWVDPARAVADFQLQAQKDLRGDRIHAVLAFIWGWLVVGPISFAEAAIAFPGICWLIRLFVVPRAARWAFLQPTFIVFALFAAWHLLAITWSHADDGGFKQATMLRWAAPMFALYTILPRRSVIIAGLVAGLLSGNLSQLVNWIGVRHDIPALVLRPFAGSDRNGGWWPIVVGSEHLVAALGLHLPVVLMGKGKWRVFGVIATIVTIAGLVATGARGAWIAAVLLALVVCVVAVVRAAEPRTRWRLAGSASLVVLITASLLWIFAGERIKARVSQAIDEIPRAFSSHDFTSAKGSGVGDDSARVAMALWAIEAIKAHPIVGVGTGGYAPYVREHMKSEGPAYDDFVARNHQHCHNALLQEWATKGIVGLVLLLAFIFVVLWSAFTPLTRETLGTYAAGPAFALVGLCLLWPFDAMQSNSSTIKIFLALVALCPAWYPKSLSEARAQARASNGSN